MSNTGLLFVQDIIDTVVCGDAIEKMRELPDKSVDYVAYSFNRLKGVVFGDKDVRPVRQRSES